MADNIRYQRSGIMYAEFPTLQYANIQEEIKQARSLNASLDRISEFAYKGAVKKAEEAGMQYGIENTPSLKQVMESIKNKEKPSDLFQPSDTSFGEAARKIQVATFRTELEKEARASFTDIDAVVNSGNPYNMQEIDDELNGIVDGHSKVLAGIDPEESAKYRQSITILGNATRKNALDRIANRIEAENLAKVDEELDNLKKQVPTLLDTYTTFEDYKLVEKQLKLSVDELITRIDPTKVAEKKNEINKIFKNAVIDRIGNYVLKDKTFAATPGEASMKIMDGQAGDMTQFLNDYVAPEDRMEVVKKLTEKKVAQSNLIEANEKLTKKLREDDYRIIMKDFYDGKVGPNETITALHAKEIPISNDEYKAIVTAQDETPGNLAEYNKMFNRVNVDLLSVGEIDAAAKANRITYKQALQLKDKYFSRSDNDREIKQSVLNAVNLTSEQMLMLKPEQDAIVAKSILATTKEVEALRAKGLPVNVAEIARKNAIQIMETNSTAEYTKAKADLEKMSTTYKFPYQEDAYKPKDVDKLFKNIPKEDRQTIKRALRDIQSYNQQQKNKASF